jgi:predicted small lipoprotein YifL
MKSLPNTLALGCALLSAVACGRKGPLELPFSRIPGPVEDVVVTQRGDRAILEWTNPGRNIDGHPPVDVEAVEIWSVQADAGGAGSPPKAGDPGTSGRLVVRLAKADLALVPGTGGGGSPRWTASVPLEANTSGAPRRAFILRVLANGRKSSEFSPPVSFEPRPCALPPKNPSARVEESFVEIRWSAPAANVDGTTPPVVRGYLVYRSDDGGPLRRLTPEPVAELRFEDREAGFGRVLRYVVRAASAAADPYLESGDSEAVEIVPRDVFPPAPPGEVVGIAEGGSVSLSWRAHPDSDLAGYKVWRREEGTSREVLLTPEAVAGNVFLDASRLPAGLYFYSVSAVDRNGNESGKSAPAAVRIKEGDR